MTAGTTLDPDAPVRNILSVLDLASQEIERVLERARQLRAGAEPRREVRALVCAAFFESSTRTRLGFAAAAARLDLGFVELADYRSGASMSAAESLADTIRVASGQADLVVLRHGDEALARDAISRSVVPVISAGLGAGEHPTQALVDLFAMQSAFGRIDGLRVALIGDLAGSRAAHSLARGLGRYSLGELRLVSPPARQMQAEWLSGYPHGAVTRTDRLDLESIDVAYFAGLPQRCGEELFDAAARRQLALTPTSIRALPGRAIVLSPLPRIDEIDTAVDADPRCRHFTACDDGAHVRTALLELWNGPARAGGGTP